MTHAANERLTKWLAQESPEPVLEPDLPIVDPHHHLWDLRTATTEPFLSFEQKVYLCDEISDDIANVRATTSCKRYSRSAPRSIAPMDRSRCAASAKPSSCTASPR